MVTRVQPDMVEGLVGRQAIWVPAGAMTAATTSGAGAEVYEGATNKNNLSGLSFDPATIEYAHFQIQMPPSWNLGTVTAKFVWKHPSTTTNFGVSWGIQGVGIGNAEAFDVAFGTLVTVNDTGGTTGAVYISDETTVVTLDGALNASDLVEFRVQRKVDEAGDTMAVDAHLIGVTLFYTTTSPTES